MSDNDLSAQRGVSGRFALDTWWVHLPTDEPRVAQYASAHESHHLQLQNSSSYGALQRTLVELHATTNALSYREVAVALTNECRVVQEAFATWAPVLVLHWTHGELIEHFPAYGRSFLVFDRLLSGIELPYLRLHAAHAVARACMQSNVIAVALEHRLDEFHLSDVRSRDRPDHRFALLRRSGIEWWHATNAVADALAGHPASELLLSSERLTADHFLPAYSDAWELANRSLYDTVAGHLADRGYSTLAYDGHLAETPVLLAEAERLAGQKLRLQPGDARRPERSALASLRTAEAEGFTTGAPLRCRVMASSVSPAALVADYADPHTFVAIRPRTDLIRNYADASALANGADLIAVLRRTVIDADGSPTVELLEFGSSSPQDLAAIGPTIASVSLSCLGREFSSPLDLDFTPSTSTILVDVSLAAHLDLWLSHAGAEFHYAMLRTESFGRVVPCLIGRYGQPGEAWSHLLVRPLSHAGVQVHRAAFDELRADGMALVEDSDVFDGQRRLLELTLAHVVGEEVRFALRDRST